MHKMNTQRVYGRLVHRLSIALISMTVTFIALLVATVGPGSHATIEAAGKVTIRYTYWGGQEEQEAVAELVRLFQARNPDIEVKAENVPYLAYEEKIPILIASGAGPDVMMCPPFMLPSLAATGALLPLDSFLVKDSSFDLDDFVAPARTLFRIDGKLYGLPREFGPYVLFYNRAMFEEKGLREPDWNWTWTTMVTAGKKLTEDRDGDGRMDSYALGGVNWINHYLPFIWQAGGDVIDRTGKKAVINSPEAIRGLQFYVDLMLKERINPTYDELAQGRVNVEEWFSSNRLAMSYNSRIAVSFYNQFRDLDYDVAPLPKGPATHASLVDPAALAVANGTKQPEAAWRFVKWMLGSEAGRWMAERNMLVPARLSVARSDAFVNLQIRPRNDLVFVEMMNYGRTVPLIPQWNQVPSLIGTIMPGVLQGRVTVQNAVQTLNDRIQQLLDRQR